VVERTNGPEAFFDNRIRVSFRQETLWAWYLHLNRD
jgi:hypothetical protein